MSEINLFVFKDGRLDQLPMSEVVKAVLPDQTGKSGLFLETNGSEVFWAPSGAGPGGQNVLWSDGSQVLWPDGSNVQWGTP